MSEMVEVNAREVEGAVLDWLVAKSQSLRTGASLDVEYHGDWLPLDNGSLHEAVMAYMPSEDWAQGGPLIEKYQLTLSSPKSSVHRNGGPSHGWGESGVWSACTWEKGVNGKRATGYHESSALTAAMRTIVRFELGDSVEVPKELVT